MTAFHPMLCKRRSSLAEIRRLLRDHSDAIDLFGYHDPDEFPGLDLG